MKKLSAVMILALIFSLGSYAGLRSEEIITPEQLVIEAKAHITEVSVDDVKKMMDNKENVVLLDIREREEYDKGHLPGAVHLSRGRLEFYVQEIIPDKNAKIVVMCQADKRSPLAVRLLNSLGYKNAVNMKGGFKVWIAIGYPFERGLT